MVLFRTSVILVGCALGCVVCLFIALFCRILLVGSVHVEAMTQAPYEKPEDPEIQVARVQGQTGTTNNLFNAQPIGIKELVVKDLK